jgi:hypothetical protein
MRYRLILFFVFGAILSAIGEWNLSKGGTTESALDRWWLEFCVANARDRISEPAVTLVAIDDEYRPAIGETLSHADYAAAFGFVGKFEPKSIAFEPNPVFDENLPINQPTLELLKEAVLPLPRLTLGVVGETGQPPQNPNEKLAFESIGNVDGDISQVTPLTRLVAPAHPQLLSNGLPAFTGIELAGDEATRGQDGRTLPLIARDGEKLVPSFVLRAVAAHAGVAMDAMAVRFPPGGGGSISVGDRIQIPIDARGRMKIYEHSGVGLGFYPSVSALHLALAGDQDEAIRKLQSGLEGAFESLKANLVVIGHDREQDRRETVATLDRPLSRAEWLVRAIATIQSGRFIDRWPQWARLLSLVIIATVAAIVFRLPRRKVVIWGVIGAFLWFGFAMMIFKSTLAWAPLFAPLSLFGLMLVIGLILPEPKPQPVGN